MILNYNSFSFPENAFAALRSSEDLRIEISVENTKRVCYDERFHRLTDEKYIFEIGAAGFIRILCSGSKSAFYALCDLERRIDEHSLTPGSYTCAPSYIKRGFIEGFYGRPWTAENRIDMLRLMAKHRMNTFYYAPKDDPYHRSRWMEPYPADTLRSLKTLITEAKKNYITFHYCIAPGLSIRYSSEADFDALLRKTNQLYAVGVRAFGLLLDDIGEALTAPEDIAAYGETVNAHIDLCCRYSAALNEIDPTIELTVCPTLYHGRGEEYYISKLGQNLPPETDIFWTGKDICSRELTAFEALRFIENTNHRPLYWDNYPVNDEAMYHEMHLGPVIGRDPSLPRYAKGLIANCMEYAECSKIPLITVADYLWDSEHYDPEISYEAAIAEIIGSEHLEAFLTFGDHLYISCLQNENSRRMKSLFSALEAEIAAGNRIAANQIKEDYASKLNACRAFLKSDRPICKELSRWALKFDVACDIILRLFDYIFDDTNEALRREIETLIEQYNRLPARLITDFDFREVLMGRFRPSGER